MTAEITTGESQLNIGIDVGSTTAKIVVVDNGKIVHERYERHFSQVREKLLELFKNAYPFIRSRRFGCALSGSAGLGIAAVSYTHLDVYKRQLIQCR